MEIHFTSQTRIKCILFPIYHFCISYLSKNWHVTSHNFAVNPWLTICGEAYFPFNVYYSNFDIFNNSLPILERSKQMFMFLA